MKKNSLKKLLYLMSIMMLAGVVMVSCKKDDDDDDPTPPPTPVEDGIYVVGAGTALTDFDLKGLMKPTINEVGQEPRASLLELFVAVKGGSDGFNIIKVEGSTETVHGPGGDFGLVAEEDLDVEEPRDGVWRGSLAVTDTKFTVPEDGLYHVVYDTELNVIVIARVKWGLIGAATPGGWSDDTPMNTSFDLNKMEFTVTEVTLFEDPWKFRYSGGWKVFIDDEGTVKVNANLGGSVSDLEPGGADIMHDNYGVYTVKLTWELGEKHVAELTRTGDGEPLPEYPEAMFLVGDATAYGWATPGEDVEAIMHKLAGGGNNEGIFWKIAHLDGGIGFKLAAENWGSPNLGFNEVDEFDAEGVMVADDGEGNMMIDQVGMFMIVLNLRDDMVKVSIKPAAVYGIGDAFGGWDAGVEDNKFAVDNENKAIISPRLPADGNIRMYAAHSWISDWWHAEFNVFDGKIEYRNDGGDQEAVPGTEGQQIMLYFDDNTGSIN